MDVQAKERDFLPMKTRPFFFFLVILCALLLAIRADGVPIHLLHL